MSLAKAIKEKEADLRKIKDHEIAVVFDAFGHIVIELLGGASSVDLSPYINQIRDVGGATLVHNHPMGWQYPSGDPRHIGSSFSPEDVETACYAELVEIRAVGPGVNYSMRPPLGTSWSGDFWISIVQPIQKKHKAAVIRSTLQSVREGKLSRETAEAEFWHEVWLRVADDTAVVYQRFENE